MAVVFVAGEALVAEDECGRVPLYQAMYSTTARLAPVRVGQARVSMNSPFSEEKKLSAGAFSRH